MSISRIGKLPIIIPKGVTVTLDKGTIKVKGPKGELQRDLVGNLDFKIEGDSLIITVLDEHRQTKAYHGLMRALINNMVIGVNTGFTRRLRIIGVGYRGESKGDKIILNVGYSNPVEFQLPKEVAGTVSKEGTIELTAIDKELLGDVAARIRKIRKPDSYKGKGIRYDGEVVRIKPGKSASKG
jgi:large subunit ribosomal protein L6